MYRTRLILACALGLCGLTSGVAMARAPDAEPAQANKAVAASEQPADTRTVGVWQPPSGLKQIPIWPNRAPDTAEGSQPPESVEVSETPKALEGHISEGVFDVSSPTMTVFPPKGTNTGVAMIVFPGGGFKALAITGEGTEICGWLTSKGITCIVSKYRVPNSNHYWEPSCRCHITPKVPLALQDAQRSIRLVRARAQEWNVDPHKIGVIGFSAGGYLVAQTSNIFKLTYKPVDAVDKVSSRPDFAIAAYPGHLCRSGGTLDPGIHVTRQTPPTFLLQAWNDPVDAVCNTTVYARALDAADVPTEVHLFAKGKHAFALRGKNHPIAMWPSLVESWLKEIEMLP